MERWRARSVPVQEHFESLEPVLALRYVRLASLPTVARDTFIHFEETGRAGLCSCEGKAIIGTSNSLRCELNHQGARNTINACVPT